MYEFKWRMHDPAIGRFMQIDPLAEDYVHNSTYAFAENKVISHIELEGLEGLHHTKVNAAGNRSHTIQKNVVVLTRQTKSSYPDRKNARITRNNNDRVNNVKSNLNNSYANAKNSAGESVKFEFNVTGMEVENTKTVGSPGQQKAFADENGLVGENGDIAPAAIITTEFSDPSTTNQFQVKLENSNEVGHEVGHTMMTETPQQDEESPPGTGGLMDDPPGRIIPIETDKMIRDAVPAINND